MDRGIVWQRCCHKSWERVWKIAREEIEAYRARVKELGNKNFEDIDPGKDVLELYLGKAKSLIHLMETELGLLHAKVTHFLGTHCVQKAFGLSVTNLYSDDDDQIKECDLIL
jgi:hypothetical protein